MKALLCILLFLCLLAMGLEVHFLRRGTSLARASARKVDYIRSTDIFARRLAQKQTSLRRMGAGLLLKDQLTVGQWYLYKLVLAVAFGLIASMLAAAFDISAAGLAVALAAVAGWLFLDLYLKLKNDASNEAMLPDIMELSRTVKNGNRGGQFISYALTASILELENKRLKLALIGLKNRLDAGMTLEAALDDFEEGFSNAEISSFCTVIKALQTTGQVDEALSPRKSNIERPQVSFNKRRTILLEKKTMLYVILIAMDIIAMILYCILMRLVEMQLGF